MKGTRLPNSFCGEAVHYGVYIVIRFSTSAVKDMTREAWFESKSGIDHLKDFGYVAMLASLSKWIKFGEKGAKCLFIMGHFVRIKLLRLRT